MSALLTDFGPQPIGAPGADFTSCRSSLARAILLAVVLASATMPVEASAMDWLTSATSRNKKSQPTAVARSVNVVTDGSSILEEKIVGNDLDSYKFAQSHWTSSKKNLEKACRAISSYHNDAAVRDMLQKLFVIDTQLFRENIKNSALLVNEIKVANQNIRQGLTGLTRIVTAPGQETLDALEKNVDQLSGANVTQSLLVKKYLAGAERTIMMAQASYETLELIPSLSLTGLDMLVQMSKQLMRMTQSNSEAFKGLLLNVQTSSEQIGNGLENIKKTVRETLRFSDHFAIKQFPLINLPAPTREKIYVQLNALANNVRGVDNTIAIGDSQARNNAQQFTHLISGFVAKAAESLRYQSPGSAEKALEQISTYARNQVSGLFLRVKEDITQMRQEMAKASRPTVGNMPPKVNFESRDDFAARQATSVSKQKLPLFLLGGGQVAAAAANQKTSPANTGMIPLQPSAPAVASRFSTPTAKDADFGEIEISSLMPRANATTQILYQEKAMTGINDQDLMQSEVNILSKELGSDFFFGSEGDNLSRSSLMAQGGADMPTFGEEDDDELQLDDNGQSNSGMRMSYSNLEDNGEPRIEMMKLDSSSAEGDDELINMLRFDGEMLDFE